MRKGRVRIAVGAPPAGSEGMICMNAPRPLLGVALLGGGPEGQFVVMIDPKDPGAAGWIEANRRDDACFLVWVPQALISAVGAAVVLAGIKEGDHGLAAKTIQDMTDWINYKGLQALQDGLAIED